MENLLPAPATCPAVCLLPSAFCSKIHTGVLSQYSQEGRGRMRECNVATVCYPERSEVAQLGHGNGRERTALQLFGDAHSRDERQAYLKLNETFDSFYCSQLEGDV